jgi:hypothetical protein
MTRVVNIAQSGSNNVTMRNRIINGAMMIDQRNAGAAVATSSGTSVYVTDRFVAQYSQTSKYTLQQNAGSVTPPAGFTNYLGATSSSAYSVGSTDYFTITQKIEGFSLADLGWGTASASTVTLSFWVRSSLTGTFGGVINNVNFDRSYPFAYTIISANTWEQKTITIVGDTGGTWNKTNGIGAQLQFGLGVGSTYNGTAGAWASSGYISATGATSVVGTNGATFYITGVQLEAGTTASPFEQRLYGTELALCQRYFEKSYRQTDPVGAALVQGYSASPVGSNTVPSSQIYSQISFATVKRTSPTITLYGYEGGTGKVSNANSGVDLAASSGLSNSISTQGFQGINASGGTITTTYFAVIYHWIASAEL